MFTRFISIAVIFLATIGLISCGEHHDDHNPMHNHSEHQDPMMSGNDKLMQHDNSQHAPAALQQATQGDNYLCPMHPHITGEEGDTCPICGMDLVPKKTSASIAGMGQDDNIFRVDPAYLQNLGVKTEALKKQVFGHKTTAFGQITPSTRLEKSINVRTKGWIVDLNKSAMGDTVHKGDLLFTYYSPDLMKAQADFLVGTQPEASEQRLKLLGMSNQAIRALKKQGKFMKETPFYASDEGIVSNLNVTPGGFLPEGGYVMTIQDYSTVWVKADIPLQQLSFIQTGTPATVTQPETNRQINTIVDYIYPTNNPNTRTGTVRLKLQNRDNQFKPNSFVDVQFESERSEKLAVPNQAVLYSQSGAFVIESLGEGQFRPHQIETGISNENWTEVKSGLDEGQIIVTSGQFMLDAESNLRGGFSSMTTGDSSQSDMSTMGGQAHAH